ncbi:hypothetical protein Misp06_02168 [Microbulbifer sp. NBRC 101763]|uniref:hypothetical protein n=1 Tax=Microbulbifer sp. NBRC 101763 TaxID=1113820 RepID=UPI003095CDFF
MYLLLSGEGPGDIGTCCTESDCCDRTEFKEGPMTIIVDQLVGVIQQYEMSYLDTDRVSYVSESYLAQKKQAPRKKQMSLKGKKRPPETKYYFENARALATVALAKQAEVNDSVVAVLFRDSDGTASAGRGDWKDKRDSMLAGFAAENYELGVAMIPKPKSEAWLLCAVKQNPYQHCANLESESGNDNSINPLKSQLEEALNGGTSTQDLNQLIRDKSIDAENIDMPSFTAFKACLEYAVKEAHKSQTMEE